MGVYLRLMYSLRHCLSEVIWICQKMCSLWVSAYSASAVLKCLFNHRVTDLFNTGNGSSPALTLLSSMSFLSFLFPSYFPSVSPPFPPFPFSLSVFTSFLSSYIPSLFHPPTASSFQSSLLPFCPILFPIFCFFFPSSFFPPTPPSRRTDLLTLGEIQ